MISDFITFLRDKILIPVLLGLMLSIVVCGCGKEEPVFPNEAEPAPSESMKNILCISDLDFYCVSSHCISLTWADDYDDSVAYYEIYRSAVRKNGEAKGWELLEKLYSDDIVNGERNLWTDKLDSASAVQYLYKIVPVVKDGTEYTDGDGHAILASNVLVCLDPGHFKNYSPVQGENSYGYDEGTYMLQLGLRLRDVLRKEAGIDVLMTRETDSITISGYSDGLLDSAYINLRGEYAAGADLFLSLHTNANLDYANGAETFGQPVEICKPILLINAVGKNSELCLNIANAIGENLAATNYECGLAGTSKFDTANKNTILTWSDAYNDSVDQAGTVCFRAGQNAPDFYGVLRGASEVHVPGLIIEHGFHTVPEVRNQLVNGDLLARWAKADAKGIAQGFGFNLID